MFNDLSTALNFVLLATALVLGALNVRNKYEKGNDDDAIKNLEVANTSFKARREADQIVIAAKEAENTLLKQQNQVYKDTITQAPAITEMMMLQAKQHKEVMELMRKVVKELSNLAKVIGKKNG